MLSIFVLFGAAIIWLFVRSSWKDLKDYRKARTLGCQPYKSYYPHLDPLLGIDLAVQTWRDFSRGLLAEGVRRHHEKLGHTFRARGLGGSTCIYTIDPDNIRTVTTGRAEDYGRSAWVDEAAKHVGRGILMNEGAAWKQSRARLRPIFARAALDETALVEPHVQRLAEAVVRGLDVEQGASSTAEQTKKPAVEFQTLATRFILDVVTDFLFGKSTRSLDEEQEKTGMATGQGREFLSLVKDFEPPSGAFIAVGMLAWIELLPSYKRLIRVVEGMKAFFRRQLQAIIASDSGFDYSGYPDSGSGLDDDKRADSIGTSCFRMMKNDGVLVADIQAELQNIFFASFDTTAALIANLVDILSRRQDVQQRLRADIACLAGRAPTKQKLAALPYLRFVMLETLRLYTPVTSHSRQAVADTVLPHGGGSDGQGSVFVPAGATIIWSTYALNRDPRFYGNDWTEFRPERWEKLPTATTGPFFMPFGSGPRACMGQQMAWVEASYTLVRLLQLFPVIESRDPRPFCEAPAVSYYNGHGTLVSMQ